MFFGGRGRFLLHLYQFYAVKPQLRMLAQLSKRLSPLLAAPFALLLSQAQAKAMLNVNIFDEGSNLKVTVTGSISAGNAGIIAAATDQCYFNGALTGQSFNTTLGRAYICTGYDQASVFYALTGPPGFGGNGSVAADSVEGLSFQLYGLAYSDGFWEEYNYTYALDPDYVLGQPFYSSATFNGRSLSSEGLTARGLVGTWTINGTSESINVYIGSTEQAPGPLPLFGAAAAFGWSRRLRKRIATDLIIPPQA